MCKIIDENGMIEVDIKNDTGYGGIGHFQAVLDQTDPTEEDF
ncbi:MAG: hypothetical protein P1P85_05180 [Patescibacteria group bacterium]|nr:hypothetical protein [Patescibacteria group bacterium]